MVVEQVSRFSLELDSPWNTAYERLLRRLLQLPGAPAVVALQAYAYRRSGKAFQNVGRGLGGLAFAGGVEQPGGGGQEGQGVSLC